MFAATISGRFGLSFRLAGHEVGAVGHWDHDQCRSRSWVDQLGQRHPCQTAPSPTVHSQVTCSWVKVGYYLYHSLPVFTTQIDRPNMSKSSKYHPKYPINVPNIHASALAGPFQLRHGQAEPGTLGTSEAVSSDQKNPSHQRPITML